MRYAAYYVNMSSKTATGFDTVFLSVDEARKYFKVKRGRDAKQINTTDESIQMLHLNTTDESIQMFYYNGLILCIVREDNPLYTWVTLNDGLFAIDKPGVIDELHKQVTKMFDVYQLWMREHLAKQKK